MSDIVDHQRRITAALDRIRQQLEAGVSRAEAARKQRHELERLRVALSERDREVAELARVANAVSSELDHSAKLIAELADTNRALREAAAAGIADAHLLNQAALSELGALRSARAVEIAEMGAILQMLEPVLGPRSEGAHDA